MSGISLPTYATTAERAWHYVFLTLCGAVLLFLILPVLVVIPLSFNAEPYFSFASGIHPGHGAAPQSGCPHPPPLDHPRIQVEDPILPHPFLLVEAALDLAIGARGGR